tara:strand:- start:3537 stop:4154 length:618 start_codon:yes stop_codon:yes gene_type:complete
MSIVAMKRKSRGANNPISAYGNGFSLNGGHRNKGWVGQSSLGRSNSYCSANDANIIKMSSMSNNGYITSRIRNPTSVFNADCNSTNTKDWVKVFNEQQQSQGAYIDNVHTKTTVSCEVESTDAGVCKNKCNSVGILTPAAINGAISSSDYMKTGLLIKNCLPTPNCMAPWPQWINHNSGCNINYTTPGAGFPVEWNWGECKEPYY